MCKKEPKRKPIFDIELNIREHIFSKREEVLNYLCLYFHIIIDRKRSEKKKTEEKKTIAKPMSKNGPVVFSNGTTVHLIKREDLGQQKASYKT